jgi:cytoskeletal protein CcmA (bactofilin family)
LKEIAIMFEKRKDTEADEPNPILATEPARERPPATRATSSAATIGSSIRIKGEVSGEEDLIIQGHVEGAVKLAEHDLVIGESGRVDADLNAKTIRVEGEVNGDVIGSTKVVVTRSGRVLGNIIAPRVTLEDGAKFKGSIDMDPGQPSAAKTAGSTSSKSRADDVPSTPPATKSAAAGSAANP